jgi:hypothetical protein
MRTDLNDQKALDRLTRESVNLGHHFCVRISGTPHRHAHTPQRRRTQGGRFRRSQYTPPSPNHPGPDNVQAFGCAVKSRV